MNDKSIDLFMAHVNQTIKQAKTSDLKTLAYFAAYGALRLAGFAAVLWIIRHI